jgi:hypothetical protein
MERTAKLVLLVLLALPLAALTACSDDGESVESGDDTSGTSGSGDGSDGSDGSDADPGATGDDPDAPVTNDPDMTGITEPGGPGDARPIEPSGDAVDPHPSAFTGVEPSDDDLSLTVSFSMGVDTCYSLDRVEVDETDTTVTVTLFVGGNPDVAPDTACIEIAELRSVTVPLDAPLGDREVVDGAV